MSNNPQTDFDGCRRACRRAGAHTLVYGECEQGPEPEPTVSLPRVYTAADGFLAVGFDTYTVPQLARLIEAEVGDPLRAAAAARAIVHRHDSPGAPPAVPTRVSDMTDRRERYATAIREADGWVLDDGQHMIDAVMAVADTELAARRAADLRDAEEICDEAGASYTAKALNEHADAAYELMARFRRKAEKAEQAAVLPAVPVPPATPATDQAELVETAAQAIRDSNGTPEALEWWRTHPQLIPAHVYAAAVLAVLPPPADRAAVCICGHCEVVARELRRMADEAQQRGAL